MEDLKVVNRSSSFVNNTRRAYNFKCAVTGNDLIQCDVAHIMPLNGRDGQDNWENPEILKASTASCPLRRIGEPDEIGGAAVFLASQAGTFVNGHTLVIDGGSTA